jgi:hypothetical protein
MTKEQFILVAKQIAKKPVTTHMPLCLDIDVNRRVFRIPHQRYHGAKFNDKANIANPKRINFCSAFAPQLSKYGNGNIYLYVQGTGSVDQTKWFPIPMSITWDDLYDICKAISDYNKAMEEYETKKDTFGHSEFHHWFTTEYTAGYIQAGIKRENLALDLRLSIDQTTGKKSLTVKTQKYRWGNFNPINDYTNFIASNGVVLSSITHPEWNTSNRKVLYLRGTDTNRDDISLDVSDMSFSELREIYMAVFEYNVAMFEYEQKKATPVLSEKEKFIAWFHEFHDAPLPFPRGTGALKVRFNPYKMTLEIVNQRFGKPGRAFNPMMNSHDFTASNGFRFCSCLYPKMMDRTLYVRGKQIDRDNEVLDLSNKSYDQIKNMLEAIREYNIKVYEFEQNEAKEEIIGNSDHLQISMTDKTLKVLSLKHKGNSFSSPHTFKFFSRGVVFSASEEIPRGIYLNDMRVGVNFGDDETYDISKWTIETRNNFKRAVTTYNEWCEDIAKGVRLDRNWNLSYILMGIE